jgi:hypothetical protein
MNHSPRRRCESLHEQGEIGRLREETVEQVHLDGCEKKESNRWILYGKSSMELVRSQAS